MQKQSTTTGLDAIEAEVALAATPVLTSSEIKASFELISSCYEQRKIRQAIDILKELMDRVVVHIEALGLARSRPQEATNPNIQGTPSNQSSAVVANPSEFWKQINKMFLRLFSALRAESTIESDWMWLQDCVMGWSTVLRWYGLVDYELGFWAQDILRSIELGKAAMLVLPQHPLLYQQNSQQQTTL